MHGGVSLDCLVGRDNGFSRPQYVVLLVKDITYARGRCVEFGLAVYMGTNRIGRACFWCPEFLSGYLEIDIEEAKESRIRAYFIERSISFKLTRYPQNQLINQVFGIRKHELRSYYELDNETTENSQPDTEQATVPLTDGFEPIIKDTRGRKAK